MIDYFLNCVRAHQLLAFFVLAYLLSWWLFAALWVLTAITLVIIHGSSLAPAKPIRA